MYRFALVIIILLMALGGAGWLILASRPGPETVTLQVNQATQPVQKSTTATAPVSRPAPPPPAPQTKPASSKPATLAAAVPLKPATRVAPATTQALAKATTRPVEPPPAFKVVRGRAGFWQIVQNQNGVWWFCSPDGQLEFLNTVTTVQPYQLPRDKTGPHFVSRDWVSTGNTAADLDRWATATLDRLHSYGFKGLGAWCHPVFHRFNVPITRDLNAWTWVGQGSSRFYSADWAPTVEAAIKQQVEALRDNKNLVGYFIDNELDWGDGGSGPGTYFDSLPPSDPNRQQVRQVIQSVWKTLAAFNADWNANLTDWNDLDSWKSLPREQPQSYLRLERAWISRLAEDYFRTTTTFIRKYDPNHLILGVRYKGHAPLEVVRAARGYTDAQSLNYYVGDARLDMELFRMIHEQSDQPIILSEYAFHSLDGRSGNRNTFGFVSQVLDQRARADGYKLFTTRLARVPYVIGADWFQWCDEPPSGRVSDGEDVNFGIVDIDDRPYPMLVQTVQETTPLLNPLHEKSHRDPQLEVWRDSFANKPVINVPSLNQPPLINGELSDWPPQCKLTGLRHSPTLGLERSSIPLPNVYLGWTNQGIYLGMEIFDNDIHGAPPKGWWWTRDCVEMWFSTRPVASNQNEFDIYCHHYFFVPIEFPGPDGLTGAAGQWHRSGDALKDHLIPHPAVKHASRILPDRYVVEMLIPFSALNGSDPIKQPAMAFNINVRNFEHALSYFWSAPKEVMTQYRPNTWGTISLRPPDSAIAHSTTQPAAVVNTAP